MESAIGSLATGQMVGTGKCYCLGKERLVVSTFRRRSIVGSSINLRMSSFFIFTSQAIVRSSSVTIWFQKIPIIQFIGAAGCSYPTTEKHSNDDEQDADQPPANVISSGSADASSFVFSVLKSLQQLHMIHDNKTALRV